MRKLLVAIGFVLVLLPAWAQFPLTKKYDPDSLISALKLAKSPELKTRLNYLLSLYWSLSDVEKAKPYLQEAKKYSQGLPLLQAVYPYCEAYVCWDTEPARSESLFMRVSQDLARFKTPEAYFLRAKSLRNYALHQQTKDDDKAYVNALLKAIPLAKQSNDSVLIGTLHQDVAIAFMNAARYEKSTEYFQTAISYIKNRRTPYTDVVKAYALLAENYAFSRKDYDKAKVALDEAAKLLKGKPVTIQNVEYYLAEGMYHVGLKEYQNSVNSFDKGLKIAHELERAKVQDAHYMVQQLSYQKYFVYSGQHNYTKALQVLKEFLVDTPRMSVHNRQRVFLDLSKTYAGLGQPQLAYNWLSEYSKLRDSVYDSDLRQEMGAMEVKFKNAENKKKIVELEAEKQQEALKAKNNRLFSWLLGIGCVALLFVALFSHLLYRKNRKLSAQKLREVEQEQELQLTQAMLQGEERERQRVARDLHDGIGGLLAGIKINLSRQSKMEKPQSLDGVIAQIDHSVAELRRIARNMMPESLLKVGLEEALRDLCESLEREEMRIEFMAYGLSNNMAATIQANIYRIVQEILSNAVRHSDASKIIVQCSQNSNIFLIDVEDDGKGFDVSAVSQGDGMGFGNIKNRVEYLKGKMTVNAALGKGASIHIELDLSESG